MTMTIGTIISLSAAALAAFISMILDSMAADAALSGNTARAHSLAKSAAIMNGLTFFAIVVGVLFVVFSKPIAAKLSEANVGEQIASLQSFLKGYAASK